MNNNENKLKVVVVNPLNDEQKNFLLSSIEKFFNDQFSENEIIKTEER